MGNTNKPISVDEEQSGDVVGTYEGLFLGSVPVKSPSGNHICEYAVRRIGALQLPVRLVGIVIGTKGVFIVARDTGDLLCSIELEEGNTPSSLLQLTLHSLLCRPRWHRPKYCQCFSQ